MRQMMSKLFVLICKLRLLQYFMITQNAPYAVYQIESDIFSLDHIFII